jgi:GT2 family glycosyltransferase
MSSAAEPRLSIVIVTYNSVGQIDDCLRSIAHDGRPRVDHEILVVDNSSTDGTSELIRAQWTGVRIVDAGGNLGFSRANNLGIRNSSGDLLLLLNPDTVVPAGAIDTMVSVLTSRPDVAILGPRLVDAAGRPELSFGRMMSPLAELRQKVLVRRSGRRGLLATYVNALTQREREVDWVSGACLLVRRADAESVGLMDERFFMYAEDVDFCAAVRARGRRVLFTPAATVTHLRGQSRASASAATEQAYRRSQIAFYEKHHPAWAPLLRSYLKLRGKLPDNRFNP